MSIRPVRTGICGLLLVLAPDLSAIAEEAEVIEIILQPVLRIEAEEEGIVQFLVSDDQLVIGDHVYSRSQMDAELNEAMKTIESACTLTESQKERLRLAGKADRTRFLERVAIAEKSRIEGPAIPGLAQELTALQRLIERGLLGGDSFFAKALNKRLSADELERCREARLHWLTSTFVNQIQEISPLQTWQSDLIVERVRGEIRDDSVFWVRDEVGYLQVRKQIARTAADTIKPVLSDDQWQRLQAFVATAEMWDLEAHRRAVVLP